MTGEPAANGGEGGRSVRSGPEEGEVAAIVGDYVEGVLERNPQVATVVGVHDHDGAVPSADAAAVEREIGAARDALEALEDVDEGSWSARVSRAALRYDVYEMDEVARWRADPDAADGIAALITPLYLRAFAPFPERLELIADRLEGCPEYVEDVMDRVTAPVAPWVARERDAVEELPGLLRMLADEAGDLERQDVAYRLNAAVGEVLEALEDYDDWLAGLDGRNDWRLDPAVYGELLARRQLPEPDEVAVIAEEALAEATEALREAVDDLGVDDPEDGAAVVREDHPESPGDMVPAYVETAAALRDAVRDEGLAPLPASGGVSVAETPERLRPLIPQTGYLGPAAFAPGETPRYLVTPPPADGLPHHNAAAVTSSVARDLFPGHHLQQVHAAAAGPTLPLVTGHFTPFGDGFVDGWRRHAERLVTDTALGDAAFRLVAARNAVEEACLARIDVGLHAEGMSVRDAASYLVEEAGLDREAAVAEARATTRSPGYRLSGCVGAAELRELVADARDAGMTAEEVHGAVLEGGRAPVAMHRERVLDGEG